MNFSDALRVYSFRSIAKNTTKVNSIATNDVVFAIIETRIIV